MILVQQALLGVVIAIVGASIITLAVFYFTEPIIAISEEKRTKQLMQIDIDIQNIDFLQDLKLDKDLSKNNATHLVFATYVLDNLHPKFRADIYLHLIFKAGERGGLITTSEQYVMDAMMYRDNKEFLCTKNPESCELIETIHEGIKISKLDFDVSIFEMMWIAKSAGAHNQTNVVQDGR